MPTYEYQCKDGHITEEVHSMHDFPPLTTCRVCGCVSKRILSSCATHIDSPSWLNQGVRDALQGDHEKPIETRSELRSYLKAKDITPVG